MEASSQIDPTLNSIYISTSTIPYLEQMSIHKTYNTKGNNDNFFFNPRLYVRLFKPKVIKQDSYHITLLFEKDKGHLLYSLLKKIEIALYNNTFSKFNLPQNCKKYNLFYETETGFSLKLYLPKNNNTYCVKMFEKINNETKELKFRFPKLNSILDQCDIEIKNIWLKNKVFGFNLELKSVLHNFDSIF